MKESGHVQYQYHNVVVEITELIKFANHCNNQK